MSRLATAMAGVLSIAGLGAAATVVGPPGPGIAQPIAFNHARHAEFEIECADCHEGVLETAFATLPRVQMCMECHEEDATTTPDKDVLLAHAADETQIPWARLYRLPAHVVFSHERHVTLGGLQCAECHGDHGLSERPPPRPHLERLTMDGCMACHEEHGTTNDCIACHK